MTERPPLTFGTAGVRGRLGPGPSGIDRHVVARVAGALLDWLDRDRVPGPVVVGRDARRGSDEFAGAAADVVADRGREVVVIEDPCPTPLLAFAVRAVGAAGGLMITASHNPASDNGVKVYGPGGSQLAGEDERFVAERFDASLDLRAPAARPHRAMDVSVVDAYLDAIVPSRPPGGAGDPGPVVAWTAMHGVGGSLLSEVLARSGVVAVGVAEQASPDPAFSTVASPNPEDPSSLELLLALARSEGADLALALDPDADRLAVAVPDPAQDGGWRVLTGDEVGVLLADHLLAEGAGADRLVATTVVSSELLARVAAGHGVVCAITLTGFKWLADAAVRRPDLRPILRYEEALGYCVGDAVPDKDGLGAAAAFVALVRAESARGRTVLDRLDDLHLAHGLHATGHRALRTTSAAAEVTARLRQSLPTALGGHDVTEVRDLAGGLDGLPATDLLVLRAGPVRACVRPSGTEPKLKLYVEVVAPGVTRSSLPHARVEARALIEAVLDELEQLAG